MTTNPLTPPPLGLTAVKDSMVCFLKPSLRDYLNVRPIALVYYAQLDGGDVMLFE